MEEKVIATEQIYSGRVVNLAVHAVRLPDGTTSKREQIRHPGAVAVIALDDEQQVLLVRQYRLPAERILVELPAGTLEPGEDPREAAIRELREETGFRPGELEHLGGLFVAPGYTTEYIHLYLTREVTHDPLDGDVDEFISMERRPLREALDMIESGEIVDSKTIIGLLRVARRLGL